MDLIYVMLSCIVSLLRININKNLLVYLSHAFVFTMATKLQVHYKHIQILREENNFQSKASNFSVSYSKKSKKHV